jgi:NAD(P)H-dependent FMN reductase
MNKTTILAISGSLRAASLNTMLLKAAARLAGDHVRMELFHGIGELPLFNPDIEATNPPAVARFRTALQQADAVLIASPEYAHGVTGVMKNALDWMVGNETFVNKPVALFNASPRSSHAQTSLRETIGVMSARIIEAACISVPIQGSGLTEDDIVADPDISSAIREAIAQIHSAAASGSHS